MSNREENQDGTVMAIKLQIDGSSGNAQLEQVIAEVMNEYFELWKQKQRAYGPDNIAEFADMGCLIRANDKMKRLKRHYVQGEDININGEHVEDSWLDLLGYAAMGLICYRLQWPGQIVVKGGSK